MADGIYVSMNGASARMAQLESVSDNLANAQTPGFKAIRPSFEAFLAKSDSQEPARIYTAAVATQVDLSHGIINETGNPLDVLPTGKSFIGLRTSQGIALTRNGHLSVDSSGALSAAGFPVVDRDGNRMTAPLGSQFRVERSGAVFANEMKVGDLGLFELTGPVDRIGSSVLAPQDQKDVMLSNDTLRLGQIELGNSSALEAAVQMVAAQRHFETSMQALQTYKKMDERVSEVGRTR